MLQFIAANIILKQEKNYMKLLKKLTSTMLSITVIASAAATGLPTKSYTSAASNKVMYSTVISQWQSRINAEKQKFPSYSYWNHKGKSSYNDETYTYQPCDHIHEKALNQSYCSKTRLANGSDCGQCYGFAYKLAKDIWGTTQFYSNNIDQNYEPKVGDNVRLEFTVTTKQGTAKQSHSIFITGISGNNITFADCNGDLENCQIRWDRTTYYDKIIAEDVWVTNSNGTSVNKALFKGDQSSITTVNKAFLRKHGTFYDRPVIAGDLNKNGILDSGDAQIFAETVMANGRTSNSNHTPLSYYDVNGDGHVDYSDYNEIRYGTNNWRIVMPNEYPTCRWKSLNHTSGWLYYDGSYYVKNDLGGVSWIGSVDSEIVDMYVNSRVYCPSDGCWYDVTEIGHEALHERASWRTCTAGYKYKTFHIPDTVKRIHSYAFEDWTATSFEFSGSNPKLETIDQFAFYNCKSLKTLDLSPAKKLKTVGNYAFEGCTALYHVDIPYTGSAINLGSGSGSIFGNTDPSSATIEMKNPNNSTSPSSNYQRINISDKDYNYWLNNNLYYHGKLFKLYHNNTYLGKVDTYINYLRP